MSPLDEEVDVESDDGDVFKDLAGVKLDAVFEQLKERDEGGEPPTGKGAPKGAPNGATKGAPNGAAKGAPHGAPKGGSKGKAAKAAPQIAEEEVEVEEEVDVDLVEDEIEVEAEDDEAMDVGAPAIDADDEEEEEPPARKGAPWKAGKGKRAPPANGKGKGAKPGAGGEKPAADPEADPEADRGGEAAAPKAEAVSATKGKGKSGKSGDGGKSGKSGDGGKSAKSAKKGKGDPNGAESDSGDSSASSDSAPRKRAKQDTGPPTGTVRSFLEDKGFGFITPTRGGDDLFFHIMTVQNKDDNPTIPKGSEVQYETEMQMGRLKVTSCTVTKWAEDEDAGKGGKGKGKWDDWAWGPWAWAKGSWKGGAAPDKGEAAKEPTSVAEWAQAQDRLFSHMSKLPADWIRIRSKSSGKLYLYCTKTGESKDGDSMEVPKSLPPNWTKLTSKSSGQTYYYNSKTGQSQFDEPT